MPRYKSRSEPELLTEFLERYTVPQLKKLALLVASHLPTRKAEILAVLQKYMASPENLRQLWQSLDSLQQAAVAEVVHSPSLHFDAAGFRAKYGQNPDWGEISRYGEMKKPSRLRLFFYHYTMPRDLKEQLKVFVPPPRAVQIRTVDEPPDTVSQTRYEYNYTTYERKQYIAAIPVVRCETERVAQHDVHAVLRLIGTGKIRASDKTKRVTAAGARAITEVLQGGDFYPPDEASDVYRTDPGPIKAFAWPLILQSAGLANLSGTKLHLTPTGKKALNSPPHKVIGTAWKRWLKTKLLDEFNRVHTIKGQTGKGKRVMTAVTGRRAVIAQALAECPVHEWIAFDEFSRFMRAAGYTFEVARDLWQLYVEEPYYGSLGYEGFGDWHIIQARYMLAFLFEYVAALGLIDVAYIPPSGARLDFRNLWGVDDLDCLSQYDGLLYIRLNGLGAWCLGLTKEYVPSPMEVQQILKVLPNLDIVATVSLSPGDVLFLEQFAEQTSDMVWKIQPVKLLKAVEEGQSVADIEAFLKAKSGNNLPDTVAIFFKETAERVSALVDRGSARLIEAQDAALAQLIANDRRLRSLCMVAGERHIVVPADNEKAFRRTLRELGYGVSV